MFSKVLAFSLFVLAVTHGSPTPHKLGFAPAIVGGEDAERNEFPWQVSLQISLFGFQSHFCGGSILDENHIVTAAHCFASLENFGFGVNLLRVVVGAHNINEEESTQQTLKVNTVFTHPNYDMDASFSWDVAVYELSSPISLGNEAQAIPLCSANPTEAVELTTSGWGQTNTNPGPFPPPKLPDVLQKVNVNFMPLDECREYYAEDGEDVITDDMLCAKPINTPSGAAPGDSGGPIIQYIDGKACLLGATSFGAVPFGTHPAVYASTVYFADFINQHASP